jgi:hypothetical protein
LKTLNTGPITNHVNIVRNANGMFAYVTIGGLNEIKVFRTDNFAQVATIPVGQLPHGMASENCQRQLHHLFPHTCVTTSRGRHPTFGAAFRGTRNPSCAASSARSSAGNVAAAIGRNRDISCLRLLPRQRFTPLVGVGGRWNLVLLVHRFSDHCDLERLSLPEIKSGRIDGANVRDVGQMVDATTLSGWRRTGIFASSRADQAVPVES